ncbi:hypothetical protein [Sphingobacterium faecium]|uniref:hypothetical protein n=1 Tax=Sphingobacterium faecium TaxID=34087 RepID=UPI003208B57E
MADINRNVGQNGTTNGNVGHQNENICPINVDPSIISVPQIYLEQPPYQRN